MARAGALSPPRSRVAALAAATLLLVAGAVLVVGPASGGRGSALVQGAAVEGAGASPPLQAAETVPADRGGTAATPAASKVAAAAASSEPAVWVAFPLKELPHDPAAFTQGLLFERWCEGDGKEAAGGGAGDAEAGQKKKPPPPTPACREVFWESTGMNGESSVRAVEVGTGAVLAATRLPEADFGEGLALLPGGAGGGAGGGVGAGAGPRLLQLTWQSGKAYWHDAAALKWAALANASGGGLASAAVPQGVATRTPLPDGWGATTGPPASPASPPPLILSDGSATLTWVDPAAPDLRALRSVVVRDGGKAVASLNELEWVAGPVHLRPGPPPRTPTDGSPPIVAEAAPADKAAPPTTTPPGPPPAGGLLPGGEVWANVWGTECVARVDPATGAVVGWVLAPSLRPRAAAVAAAAARAHPATTPNGGRIDVLNGVAADHATGRVWLGGKWWPILFEVGFADAAAPGGPFGGDAAAALAAARQVCGRSLTV
jgi:glutamine cyclotransferase